MKNAKIVKLDLNTPAQPGFTTLPNKLSKLPWKLKDSTVTLIVASSVINHISRENKTFIKFMDECWRILMVGGQMLVAVPYAGSTAFWADPTNVNGCTPQTFHFFDPLCIASMWHIYKPKPWKIDKCFFQADGILEVLLIKRDLNEIKTKK